MPGRAFVAAPILVMALVMAGCFAGTEGATAAGKETSQPVDAEVTEPQDDSAAAAEGEAWLIYEGEGDIFKISETGDGVTQLSHEPNRDEFEWEWLPDGSGVIFEQFKNTGEGYVDNMVMSVSSDGTDTKELAPGTEPSLAPDGARIVFVRGAKKSDDLFITTTSGDVSRLTRNAFHDREPAWSPDGRRIVFQSKHDGDWELWTIRPNGMGLKKLTDTQGYDPSGPVWAPDGSAIAFDLKVDYSESPDDAPASRIGYVARAGGKPTRLGKGAYGLLLGGWSPDSAAVLYTDVNQGKLFSTEVSSGGTETLLTDIEGIDYASWSPDGSRIAYTAFDADSGSDDIFLLDPATGAVTNLTASVEFESAPVVWFDPSL